ncbi:TetR family transcriptional regulator [Rhizosaccharibacter radicis]|uniref:TetR family transcriptional regulator n=1 Tax=Rhizosaccharibacter radicis TaxID=2782605 RepID=A0ABT1VZF7_9PROT|nr:TetR family transcriptional regulator [Acetobacteraceae bacterium KSS12]
MDDVQFDSALIQAAMAQAESLGWRRVSVVSAAREAGVPLDEARARFPRRTDILLRLGLLADRAALVEDESAGTERERLFDSLMRRIDVMQQYRGGVQAVLRSLPFDPLLAAMLGAATHGSMRWMAQAAGIETDGLGGALRVQGVLGVWLQTMRAWERDDSSDLSGTMAALDKALDRAERVGRMLQRPLFDTPAGGPDASGPLPDLPGQPDPAI